MAADSSGHSGRTFFSFVDVDVVTVAGRKCDETAGGVVVLESHRGNDGM